MGRQRIYKYCKEQGMSDCGAAGLLANIERESGCNSKNLQNSGNKKLHMTDEEYVTAVDNGTYTREQFMGDSIGFGLCQWTYPARKAALYDYAEKCGVSIGAEEMQCKFMFSELKRYKEVWKVLRTATAVREASDTIMLQYERPADRSEAARAKRQALGEAIYQELCGERVPVSLRVLKRGCKGSEVRSLQILLHGLGYDCGEPDGSFGPKVEQAVREFQKKEGLQVDGVVGEKSWSVLL